MTTITTRKWGVNCALDRCCKRDRLLIWLYSLAWHLYHSNYVRYDAVADYLVSVALRHQKKAKESVNWRPTWIRDRYMHVNSHAHTQRQSDRKAPLLIVCMPTMHAQHELLIYRFRTAVRFSVRIFWRRVVSLCLGFVAEGAILVPPHILL